MVIYGKNQELCVKDNRNNALVLLQSILNDVDQHTPDKDEPITDDFGHVLHEHVSEMIIFRAQAHKVGPADSYQFRIGAGYSRQGK